MNFAYVRKIQDRYYIIPGLPENHAENLKNVKWADEMFYTRRMAIRNLIKNGYELVLRGPNSGTRNVSITIPLEMYKEMYVVKEIAGLSNAEQIMKALCNAGYGEDDQKLAS